MSSADIYANQTCMLSPPAIVNKVRFDPSKRDLKKIVDDVRFSMGQADFNVEPTISHIATLVTSTSLVLEDISRIIQAYGTATKLEQSLWPKLPTIADYVDLDALYDMDEAESAFYRATKHQGW